MDVLCLIKQQHCCCTWEIAAVKKVWTIIAVNAQSMNTYMREAPDYGLAKKSRSFGSIIFLLLLSSCYHALLFSPNLNNNRGACVCTLSQKIEKIEKVCFKGNCYRPFFLVIIQFPSRCLALREPLQHTYYMYSSWTLYLHQSF